MSSVHDRACELYQQIVGILKIKEKAAKNEVNLSEQVYGKDQVQKKHRSTFYKPRYLRKREYVTNKTTAHPKGIESWSETNKIHLVGHSLGSQTIRYLQYLLKIGYFDDEYNGIDRSSWIASLTCIGTPFNGAPVIHNLGFNQKENRFSSDTWATKLIKYKVIAENLMTSTGSGNRSHERVINKYVSIPYFIHYDLE